MAPHPKKVLTSISMMKKGPGRHADGEGLYLVVDDSGARRWALRTVVRGKRCEIGLGRARPNNLAEARLKAQQMRDVARAGGDPVAERAAKKAAERAISVTFEEYATDYIAAHRPEWKNAKHAAQWTSSLVEHAYPKIGPVAIGRVDRPMILSILRPIWTTTPETASRLRGRLQTILDAAKADELRMGDNPAKWIGSLETALPRHRRKERIVHHAALPYNAVAAFLVDLKAQPGTAARALEFAILTAARTGETIGAKWDEIDFDGRVWNVPAERMKAGKPHRVPLSERVVELLEKLPRNGDVIFANKRGENDPKPLSDMAMLAVLKRMGRTDITVHGFRSTFRDWAGETTAYPREVIEHALAHQLADAAEAAYQRGDLLRKRRALMDDWSTYCSTPRPAKADVTPIRKAS